MQAGLGSLVIWPPTELLTQASADFRFPDLPPPCSPHPTPWPLGSQ